MQSILGANGIIAKVLAKELAAQKIPVRLAARKPLPVAGNESLAFTNVLNANEVDVAVAGSEVVYLTVGLEYKTKVWQEQWPVAMKNVLEACKKHQAKLLFFDNVYALGRVNGPMTEASPLNPCSKKGEVRAMLIRMIMDETQAGNVQSIIARAADFYGPDTPNSFLKALVFDRLSKGKSAQILGNPNALHSYFFTPDAGPALAKLGNTPSAYNQVWNLPVATPTITTHQFAEIIAKQLGLKLKTDAMPTWLIKMLGIFIPFLKELPEMMYQYNHPYILDSTKFEKAFLLKATPYEEGIRRTIASL